MARTRQTFVNNRDREIYVSAEPWPECFELELGEELTLIWDAPDSGDAAQIHFINENELVVWPNGKTDELPFLIGLERCQIVCHGAAHIDHLGI